MVRMISNWKLFKGLWYHNMQLTSKKFLFPFGDTRGLNNHETRKKWQLSCSKLVALSSGKKKILDHQHFYHFMPLSWCLLSWYPKKENQTCNSLSDVSIGWHYQWRVIKLSVVQYFFPGLYATWNPEDLTQDSGTYTYHNHIGEDGGI